MPTAPAKVTQAAIRRAIRAAKAEGVVAVVLKTGIAFVESDKVALPSPDQASGGNSCDNLFGVDP